MQIESSQEPPDRESPLQAHLTKAYSCAALSKLAAAIGGYCNLFTSGNISVGFLSCLIGVGLMIVLMNTPDGGRSAKISLGYFLSFAFLCGFGLGPLLEVTKALESAEIPIAFVGACLIFICFSLASMLSNHSQYICIGGTLMSLSSIFAIMIFLDIFMGLHLTSRVEIYIALASVCFFILFETQLIIGRYRNGDKDYIRHSVGLFLDFIQVFRYLLEILIEKMGNRKKKQASDME